MDDQEQEKEIARTMATRAHVRRVLDEEDGRVQTRATIPELTEAHMEIVQDLIQAAYSEPRIAHMELIQTLESLLSDPDLGPGKVYEHLEEHRAVMTYHIGYQAFAAGLKAASRGATAPPSPVNE